jgi:spore germination protein YaaH
MDKKSLIIILLTGVLLGLTGFFIYLTGSGRNLAATTVFKNLVPIGNQPSLNGFLPYWLLGDISSDTLSAMDRIFYFGLVIAPDGHLIFKVNDQEEEPGWTKLKSDQFQLLKNQLKKNGQQLSLVVHLANDATITELISQATASAINLVSDATLIMPPYGFSDLNLDIETFRNASPAAQTLFTEFVKTVSQEMKTKHLGSLSVDILPRAFIADFLLDPQTVMPHIDQAIIMAYDYHYSGSPYSGPVSPIGGVPEERTLDVRVSVGEALAQIPQEKLIVGLPLYGYEWESLSPTCPGPVIPGTGKTASAKRTEKLLADCPNCQTIINETDQTICIASPSADGKYYSHIYSENAGTLKNKMDFIKTYDLAGAAFWALGYETKDMTEILNNY